MGNMASVLGDEVEILWEELEVVYNEIFKEKRVLAYFYSKTCELIRNSDKLAKSKAEQDLKKIITVFQKKKTRLDYSRLDFEGYYPGSLNLHEAKDSSSKEQEDILIQQFFKEKE